MRILVSAYGVTPGGSSEVGLGWHWPRALARRGHEVRVLMTATRDAAVQAALDADPVDGLSYEPVAVPRWGEGVPGQIGVYVRYLAWQLAAYRRARQLTATERFDLIHHLSWGSLQLGSFLWRLDAPFVFGPVGGGQVGAATLRPYYVGRWATEAIRTFVTRYLIPLNPLTRLTVSRAALVLVNNDETMAFARRLGARDVAYLSEIGLPPDHVDSTPPEGGDDVLRLLWVGRLMPRKAVPLALRAMAALPEDAPVHLTVVGYGPQEGQMAGWIRELGLEDRVTFTGRVPFEAMAGHYRSSDALLFTSIRDSSGAQLLEAMGHGVPVITLAHHGANRLVPDDAGVKVPVTSADGTLRDLASAILDMAGSAQRRRAMAAAALAFARSQTWPQKAIEMESVYRTVVDGAERTVPGR